MSEQAICAQAAAYAKSGEGFAELRKEAAQYFVFELMRKGEELRNNLAGEAATTLLHNRSEEEEQRIAHFISTFMRDATKAIYELLRWLDSRKAGEK